MENIIKKMCVIGVLLAGLGSGEAYGVECVQGESLSAYPESSLLACPREFEAEPTCVCLFTKTYSQDEARAPGFNPEVAGCEVMTRCSHKEVPEVNFNMTIASRWKHGAGRAVTEASVRAKGILLERKAAGASVVSVESSENLRTGKLNTPKDVLNEKFFDSAVLE